LRVILYSQGRDGAFDAAHAALIALGPDGASAPIKTHNGLIAKFGQRLVGPGHLATEFDSDLNKVQSLRQLADYSGDPVRLDRAAWALERAEAFVAAVRGRFEI
jgi:uncharacterized protein (UPF0332 family)